MKEINKSPLTKKYSINATVHPVHFEDLGGIQFERMVFAFLNETEEWDSLMWLGQTGSDGGRDIWGIKEKNSYCFQCANYRKLVLKKITDDIDKLQKGNQIPTYFKVICGGTITVKQRDKIKAYAAAAGMHKIEIWSGAEFEERIRKQAPKILQRFFNGEQFPEYQAPLSTKTHFDETFALISKYRSQKKLTELLDLLEEIISNDDFTEKNSEKLEAFIFDDQFLIEYIATNAPKILIDFTYKYSCSPINQGTHLYQILKGLLSDKSNPIYSEIRKYGTEDIKEYFLHDHWHIEFTEFKFYNNKDYNTPLPLIKWLAQIIASCPSGLKEEIRYFLNHFANSNDDASNRKLYTEEEIDLTFAYDPLYNTIELFRMVLVEVVFNYLSATYLIDRILLMLYSAFDYVLEQTDSTSMNVALNNNSFTVNELLLKRIFQSYLSLFILLRTIAEKRIEELDAKNEKENSLWIIKQLFSKVDKLIDSNSLSNDSKLYYVENLIELYFKLPIYFIDLKKGNVESISEAILYQFKHSMTVSPFGKPKKFQTIFKRVCERHEFYRHNNELNFYRARRFYEYLLPFTDGLVYKIIDI